MGADPLAVLVQSIAESGLLAAENVGELRRMAALAADDPQSLARLIVQRGWLTAFQVKAFWRGEGKDLILGSYVLLDKIGEGGMGEVFRARHRHMGRDVALKIIRREKIASPAAVSRFRQEVMAAAQLSHPNIIMTYDADTDGERHFLAMEFVDGITLTQRIREQGPMPVREACDAIYQTALGLQHAHEKGLVHRDIKPSNLLLTQRTGQIKILDMGLARFDAPELSDADLNRITQEGLLVGTPDFIAPEQARNARRADIRSDIYALGGTFYFLLTGQVPYPGGTTTEKLVRHATEPIPDINRYRTDVSPLLQAILVRMLAKKPDDRFQTPAEIASALEPFCRQTGSHATISGMTQRMPTAPTTSAPVAAPMIAPSAPPPPPPAPAKPTAPTPRDPASSHSHFRWQITPSNRPEGGSNLTPAFLIATGVGLLILIAVGLMLWQQDSPPSNSATAAEGSFENDLRMVFIRIEPGRFRMGSETSETGRTPDEGPTREVEITQPFYAGMTEVTQGQYTRLMGKNPSKSLPPRDAEYWPVESVSWEDANAFCAKLNETDSRKRPGRIYRLPTEAEWEYICRAGQKARFGKEDKLGIGRIAQFDGSKDAEMIDGTPNTPKGPTRAGRLATNPFGLTDLSGNVAEWCADWFDEKAYQNASSRDPKGPAQGNFRVVRGGAWNSPASQCRCASRRGFPPDTRSNSIGFRVVFAAE